MTAVTRFGALRLVVPPGVYAPRSDTALLAEHLPPAERVLELCAGTGALALTAAARGARRVVAVDRSARAVLAARLNARLNGVKIRTLRGSLFEAVPGEQFDAIACNPPYVPAETNELPSSGPSRAWDGGRDGRALLDRLLAEAPAHLRPGGRLLVVHSSILDFDATGRALEAGGLRVDVADRLLALPGIGPWTVEYIAMRALGDPDAFLPTDLGVRHGLRSLGHPDQVRLIRTRAERWRPWRASALMHLWGQATETPTAPASPSPATPEPATSSLARAM